MVVVMARCIRYEHCIQNKSPGNSVPALVVARVNEDPNEAMSFPVIRPISHY